MLRAAIAAALPQEPPSDPRSAIASGLSSFRTCDAEFDVVEDPTTGVCTATPRQRSITELNAVQNGEMDFDCTKAADATDEDAVLEFIGSTAARDSYGDRVLVKGWKLERYRANPVFMPAHIYSVLPLGRSLKTWKDGDSLRFRIKFAVDMPGEPGQIARDWYNAYLMKYVRGTSVGFLPVKWRRPADDAEREKLELGQYGVLFEEQELLELSAAPVPSNPEALLQNSARLLRSAAGLEQFRGLVRTEVIHVLDRLLDDDTVEEPTPAPAPELARSERSAAAEPEEKSKVVNPVLVEIRDMVRSVATATTPDKVSGGAESGVEAPLNTR